MSLLIHHIFFRSPISMSYITFYKHHRCLIQRFRNILLLQLKVQVQIWSILFPPSQISCKYSYLRINLLFLILYMMTIWRNQMTYFLIYDIILGMLPHLKFHIIRDHLHFKPTWYNHRHPTYDPKNSWQSNNPYYFKFHTLQPKHHD
jgi:hypothetical protein